MKVAVPQVVADGELMFAHLRQHGSNRVSKRVPAHTLDSDPSGGGSLNAMVAASDPALRMLRDVPKRTGLTMVSILAAISSAGYCWGSETSGINQSSVWNGFSVSAPSPGCKVQATASP